MIVAVSVALGLAARDGDSADPAGDATATTETTRRDETIERAGSEEIEGADPVEITGEPAGYRITYRNVIRGSSDIVEEVTVRRPFWSETVSSDAEGKVLSVQRQGFGRLITDADKAEPIVFAIGPAPTTTDLRIAPALAGALDRAWLERREVREVVGRRCQVYRAGTTFVGGVLKPPGDPAEEYADGCFDERGLLLEEWWVLDGKPLRHRVATEVGEGAPPDLGAGWSDIATTMGVEKGGGSIRRVRPDSSPPGVFFVLPEDPPGFEHLGRFTVIPPQAASFADESGRGRVAASTADVWRRGADVLLVDQGGALGGFEVYESEPENRTVEVPRIGEVELVVNLVANEVRLHRDGGRYVRVAGTLPHDELLEVMGALVETEGSDLVVEDGPLLP